MKIVHINTSDKIDGTGIAAFRLHNAMIANGIDSKYLVLNKTIFDKKDIISINHYLDRIKKRIFFVLENITTRNMHKIKGVFSSFKYGFSLSRRQEIVEAEIIYLHLINTFINFYELENILKTRKPVFWFLHDMFAITGGCHHSFDCKNYITRCCKCSYNNKGRDLSIRQFKKKKKIYEKYKNLVFITPSKWLYDCVKKSDLTKNKQVYNIPNLIDIKLYKPYNRDLARELFLLKNNVKIIGFGASNALDNPYKGFSYFKDALQILLNDDTLKDINIEVLIFGSNYSKEVEDNIPFKVNFLGHLYDDCSLIILYNCMDVFVLPSLAESFGQTAIESLACNVPVVGFNTGGIPDIVNENTGYLAEYKNSCDLAKGISFILKNKIENVSKYAELFSVKTVLDKHIKIWNLGTKLNDI